MAIDIERRRAVMARSQKLGHCICNPQHPCPCPPLLEQNICPCAGERPLAKQSRVALTRHVRKAGCASKIGQEDLLRILGSLPHVSDPRVLVGAAAGDDAGIYQLDDRHSLVQTVDVFTPCVDDPYLFGQIAAANSLSDVYAMGGRPLTALSIVGFPIEELDDAIMTEMLRGGLDKLEEAHCALIGGHSINDEEIKCGFAVTGIIETAKVVQRDRARAGDVLVLTKPLGTGMVSFAAQLGRVNDTCLREVGDSMAALNRDAAALMVKYEAHACTDITGFGLAGHLVAMMRGSGTAAEIDLSTVPVFAAVKQCIECDILPGAIDRNQTYARNWVRADGGSPPLSILYDPQTSGGLLVSLPQKRADGFINELHELGQTSVCVIGTVINQASDTPATLIHVLGTELRNYVGSPEGGILRDADVESACCGDTPPTPPDEGCCASPPTVQPGDARQHAIGKGNDMDALGLFKDFMKAANAPGRLDARAKKLMAIALSVSQRCDPCLRIHLKGADDMGIPREEIDEAANLAIAFGGCSAMMFYKEVCDSLRQ